jgi:hypothetical protein
VWAFSLLILNRLDILNVETKSCGAAGDWNFIAAKIDVPDGLASLFPAGRRGFDHREPLH